MAIRLGSWGTPELGISEWIQRTFAPKTAYASSGGSNLFPDQNNTYSSTPITWNALQSYPAGTVNRVGPTNYPTNTSGSQTFATQTTGGGGPFQPSQPSYDPYAQIRGDIESGYSNYFKQLDAILNNDLPAQQTAQTGIAQNQLSQGLNTLTGQRDVGLYDLGTQRTAVQTTQSRNLRDLAANITNAMRAGNTYLGARGAGDSSAANMYSYALSKVGTRERSNLMQNTATILNEISGRETNLKNIVDAETRRMDSEKNANLQRVALWYQQAVQQLQQQKSQGQLGKSQDLSNLSKDILNQAMGQLQTIQQYAISQRQALDQWALNNSKTLAEAKTNLQSAASYAPQLPGIGNIVGTPQVSGLNMFTPAYGGGYSTEEEKNNLFG